MCKAVKAELYWSWESGLGACSLERKEKQAHGKGCWGRALGMSEAISLRTLREEATEWPIPVLAPEAKKPLPSFSSHSVKQRMGAKSLRQGTSSFSSFSLPSCLFCINQRRLSLGPKVQPTPHTSTSHTHTTSGPLPREDWLLEPLLHSGRDPSVKWEAFPGRYWINLLWQPNWMPPSDKWVTGGKDKTLICRSESHPRGSYFKNVCPSREVTCVVTYAGWVITKWAQINLFMSICLNSTLL